MSINRNRHKEELSTTPAAKKGTSTLSTPKQNKHDKSLAPDRVAGGRESADAKEVREARNVAMMGHVVQQGGSRKSSKNKKAANATRSKSNPTSAAASSKKQTSSKPTLAQVKRAAKPKPSITEIWSNIAPIQRETGAGSQTRSRD